MKKPLNRRAAGEVRKNKKEREFAQDFIPIKSIKNGIIETTDGRYVKILEIEPINFLLRSSEEQFNIISSFASWLKISPARIQFKSITRKADSDKHIALLREELESEDNPQCRKLGDEYIKLIHDVGSREALTRRFFLIYPIRGNFIRAGRALRSGLSVLAGYALRAYAGVGRSYPPVAVCAYMRGCSGRARRPLDSAVAERDLICVGFRQR